MKSSWVWMMVLVALGSGLIRAQPQIDVQKLSGTWYPLATAWYRTLTNPVAECKIQSNNTQSFDLILPKYSNKTCKEVSYTFIAEEGGSFTTKGGRARYKIKFVDTDYNYHIMTFGLSYKPVLFLYARKKILTEEMKAKFQSQVSKMGYKQKDIHYSPKISSCQE